jgi:hypothetical protein
LADISTVYFLPRGGMICLCFLQLQLYVMVLHRVAVRFLSCCTKCCTAIGSVFGCIFSVCQCVCILAPPGGVIFWGFLMFLGVQKGRFLMFLGCGGVTDARDLRTTQTLKDRRKVWKQLVWTCQPRNNHRNSDYKC